MRALVWFRTDLRVGDQKALHAAMNSGKEVAALFIMTPSQWQAHEWGAVKADFVLRSLRQLKEDLGVLNVPLILRQVADFQAVPDLLSKLCGDLRISDLYYNMEYEINERTRDESVLKSLSGIHTHVFHDQVILPPGSVRTKSDTYYTVYSPFRRQWAAVWKETQATAAEDISVLAAPEPLKPQKKLTQSIGELPEGLGVIPEALDGLQLGASKAELLKRNWPAGEKAGMQRLTGFVADAINQYDHDRDYPSIAGTSGLSAYLAVGAISPRTCLAAALNMAEAPKADTAANLISGIQTVKKDVSRWISELLWREFYKHLLVGFQRLSMNQPFKLATRRVPWRDDAEGLEAWKNGQTGYPIVDAAMRQLNQTGWMHNRLRMIAAMFLTKHLLIHWREGEKYFMQMLIDGDLAQNNGGWQWSASTGTDAQPYFRIFNPYSQSRKFDPEGTFLRQYLPELKHLDNKRIHEPFAMSGKRLFDATLDYPSPIVEHSAARARALSAFKGI